MKKYLHFSPNSALFLGIHSGSNWTVEIFRKLGHVGQWPDNSKLAWTVLIRENVELEHFRPHFRAPDICRAYPEHLLRSVVESRQKRFLAVFLHPLLVGQVGLLDTTVVGYVLTLSIYTVELGTFFKNILLL